MDAPIVEHKHGQSNKSGSGQSESVVEGRHGLFGQLTKESGTDTLGVNSKTIFHYLYDVFQSFVILH